MDQQNPFAVAVAAHMSRNSEKAMCQVKRLPGGAASQRVRAFSVPGRVEVGSAPVQELGDSHERLLADHGVWILTLSRVTTAGTGAPVQAHGDDARGLHRRLFKQLHLLTKRSSLIMLWILVEYGSTCPETRRHP